MAPGGTRARSAGAKSARRDALLAAARALIVRHGPRDFSVLDVAAAAGLAKGTLYLYFDSRESLLLAILRDDLDRFFAGLTEALKADHPTIDRCQWGARILASQLTAQPTLLPLLQELHTGIEPGLNREALTGFKHFLLSHLGHAGQQLEQSVGLTVGTGLIALLRAHALLIGFAHMTNRTPLLEEVLAADAALEPLGFTFSDGFVPALADQWRALSEPAGT
jgi:AcrR family transcriptional regulator